MLSSCRKAVTITERRLKGMTSNDIIGVGRFRILGGPRFRIFFFFWGGGGGGKGGPNSQQAHDVVTTSMRRNDVTLTSCAHLVFNKSVPNNYISHLKI